MKQTEPNPRRSGSLWIWLLLLLTASAGGQMQCACPAPGPDASVTEQTTPEPSPEPDEPKAEDVFECPNISGRSCSTDDDCRAPQPPPPKKPYCPNQYCGDPAVYGRDVSTDPTKPGSLPWNRGYYPAREDCECKVECASLVCLNGVCKPPPPEPVPEPPPPPDEPPQCPATCQTNADCPEQLCSDRTTCDPEKKVCINPFVRP